MSEHEDVLSGGSQAPPSYLGRLAMALLVVAVVVAAGISYLPG